MQPALDYAWQCTSSFHGMPVAGQTDSTVSSGGIYIADSAWQPRRMSPALRWYRPKKQHHQVLSISYKNHEEPQNISLPAPLPSNLVSQLSKGKTFAKNTFLCHIFHLPLVQPDDSASVSDSSSSSGCVNSCCAVCIPDKNCEVSKISFLSLHWHVFWSTLPRSNID